MNAARAFARPSDLLGSLAIVLAAGAALAGLFVPGLYRDVPAWVQQAQGADLATLVLAVPLFVLGIRPNAGSSPSGRLAALGVLLYLAYTYAVSAFSVAINPLTAVYIAVLGLSVWGALLMGASLERDRVELVVDQRLPRRVTAGFLLAVAVLFGMLWLGQLATVALTGEPPADLVALRLPTNPIYALDLAFFLPACVVAAIGLLRRVGARALVPPLLVFTALIGAEILGGFVFSAVGGDEVPVTVAVVLSAVTIGAGLLDWLALGPRIIAGPRPRIVSPLG